MMRGHQCKLSAVLYPAKTASKRAGEVGPLETPTHLDGKHYAKGYFIISTSSIQESSKQC